MKFFSRINEKELDGTHQNEIDSQSEGFSKLNSEYQYLIDAYI